MTQPTEFEIRPLVGIGPILFGMMRQEVDAAMRDLGGGEPHPKCPACNTFFNSSFQVHYDDKNRVEFIETAAHEAFRVLLAGRVLHEMLAEDAAAAASGTSQGRWEEARHTYIVPSSELALWRAVTPEANPDSDDQRGRRFDVVGAGRYGYFSATSRS